MAMEVDFGFRPLTEPKPGQTVRKIAGGTVYRHSIVALAADGDVEVRADGALTTVPYGVALNYADADEEVIVLYDPNMKYVTTVNIAPNAVKGAFGWFGQTEGNDTAKDAMNPHISQGKAATFDTAYTTTTDAVQLLEVYDHPENPVGDYSSAVAADILITVRVISELAELGA